ncbi:membrane protein insertion efficiency factor YidD [Candidatus Gracilibacteria bacterium]|nr:MAG: membrane protein insertion efficiency factor YidD [Candidatus Gracilibacteria bacterium]PIE85700.1 MAG: membrane protein insertion efficiency factor YidD [Candidatus Gracilibacteria bacterium]
MCNKHKNNGEKKISPLNKFFVRLISYYQASFSPDHSPNGKRKYPYGYCRYFPSCSEYSKECFKKYSFVKAILKSLWRVIRCNPWSKGGVDNP